MAMRRVALASSQACQWFCYFFSTTCAAFASPLTADLSGQRHHQAGIHAAAQISDHRYIRPQTAFHRTEHDGLKLVYQLIRTTFLLLAAMVCLGHARAQRAGLADPRRPNASSGRS